MLKLAFTTDGVPENVNVESIATLATLDKHWKRRLKTLTERHRLAQICEDNELNILVDHLEALVW